MVRKERQVYEWCDLYIWSNNFLINKIKLKLI